MDIKRFGVEGVYVFGSTELGTAGPGSDIDLIVVCATDSQKRRDLQNWLEGWSLCLGEVSFQLYGLPSSGLLDVKFMDPGEAKSEISSITAAGKTLHPLPIGTAAPSERKAKF
jgi:hypothetical protein